GTVQALPAPGTDTRERHGHAIAALIAVVGGVQRLVNVPDQVHDPLERLVARERRGARIGQHGREALELSGVALTVRAVAVARERSADRRVVVVPARLVGRSAADL